VRPLPHDVYQLAACWDTERTVRVASDDIVLDVTVVVDEGEELDALLLRILPHQEQPFLGREALGPTSVLDNKTMGLLLLHSVP
jgi:hypothetical protein